MGPTRPMPRSARIVTVRLACFVSLRAIAGRRCVRIRSARRHRSGPSSLEKSRTRLIPRAPRDAAVCTSRRVCTHLDSTMVQLVEEARKVVHRTGRKVVEHNDRPARRLDVGKGAFDPGVRLDPVDWHAGPQHAGVATFGEHSSTVGPDDRVVGHPALAVRAPKVFRVAQVAHQLVGTGDLVSGLGLVEQADRDGGRAVFRVSTNGPLLHKRYPWTAPSIAKRGG